MSAETPKPVSPPGAVLGEGPLWSARDNRLYWVDICGKVLHALPLDGSPALQWPMPDLICWIVEREQGGFLVGLLRTVCALTLKPFSLKPLLTVEADKTGNRLNDARSTPKAGSGPAPWTWPSRTGPPRCIASIRT